MTPRQTVDVLAILACVALALLIWQFGVSLLLGTLLLVCVLVLVFAWPEMGTLVVFFVMYANLAAIANNLYGIPASVAGSIALLFGVPLASYLTIDRERIIVDQPFILMLLFLAALGVSSHVAVNLNLAMTWITTFVLEGLILYWLIINVVRKYTTLTRVIWTLLLVGTLLGSITLYQEVTHSYNNEFFGLAQRKTEIPSGEVDEWGGDSVYVNRAGGPVDGDPNRFAQIMLALVPLGLFRIWSERSTWARVIAAICTILILSAIFLTYSHGASVTLVLLLLIMTFMRYIRPYQLLVIVASVILLMLAAPGYTERLDTIRGVGALFSQDTDQKADSSTRSRVTEMLAATMVFLDHPILGVGPGQYTKYYSIDYQLNPDIAYRWIPKARRAHSLYPELAAETGVIGFGVFMAIVLSIMYRLWQARKRWIHVRPDYANMATALMLSIIAYLGTSIFTSLAYQRYYYLLLALGGVAIQIFNSETVHGDVPTKVVERPKVLNQSVQQIS